MKLFVARSRKTVRALQTLLGSDWKVVCVGDDVQGYHFEDAILENGWTGQNLGAPDWLRDVVAPLVEGQILHL